jgi:uncharacterized protein (DUF58 family)
MFFTRRAVILLILAAPLIAAVGWAAGLRWVVAAYLLLLIGLFIADYRLAGPIGRFDLRREHDNRLSLGAENLIRLSLRHHGRQPITFWLRDEPPEQFQIEKRILSGTAVPRVTWEDGYHVRPLRRGDYQFGALNLRWLGPLGLVTRQGRLDAANPVKVYPNLLDVRRYDLFLRRNRLQELGLRHSRQFGEGSEFERLREYLPDDEYRRINWKATARRNRPVTVEYQTERSQSIMLALDIGRMMQSPVGDMAKLDYAVNAALLLAYVATGKGDKVGLTSFADQVSHFLAPKQGRGQFYRMLELLYATEAQPVEPDYAYALSYLGLKQRKRALVVVFTDLSGGLSVNQLAQHASLLARRHLLLVVTISDPDIVAAAGQRPLDSAAVYQRAAAAELLEERQVILNTLQRQGVHTLDTPANQLSVAVINRYLELKGRQLL